MGRILEITGESQPVVVRCGVYANADEKGEEEVGQEDVERADGRAGKTNENRLIVESYRSAYMVRLSGEGRRSV